MAPQTGPDDNWVRPSQAHCRLITLFMSTTPQLPVSAARPARLSRTLLGGHLGPSVAAGANFPPTKCQTS